MDRELAGLRRGYRDEQRRAADDPRPDPDEEEEIGEETTAEQDAACPFGRAWCDPSADLDDDDAMPCLSCYLRQDREDGGPHPAVDPEGRRD